MRSFSFPGTFEDDAGIEDIRWRIVSTWSPGWWPGYAVITVIRGVRVRGCDFDRLAPQDKAAAEDVLSWDRAGLTDCLLTGELPASLDTPAGVRATTIRFELDLRHRRPSPPDRRRALRLSSVVDGLDGVTGTWFEDGLHALQAGLSLEICLRACATCRFGDYSPDGHGLSGMRCHRGAKAQLGVVRLSAGAGEVPVTEEVLETYLCAEYERRVS